MDQLFLFLLIHLQSTWLTTTLLFCSRFYYHLGDGFCYLLTVAMSKCLAIGRIHWEPFRPVELLLEQAFPFFHPVHYSIDCLFSCHFPQHYYCQKKWER